MRLGFNPEINGGFVLKIKQTNAHHSGDKLVSSEIVALDSWMQYSKQQHLRRNKIPQIIAGVTLKVGSLNLL
jgi:hypothetical protein